MSLKPTLENTPHLLEDRHRAKLHILVVDDDYVTQQLLQRLLSTHYSVTVCGSVDH